MRRTWWIAGVPALVLACSTSSGETKSDTSRAQSKAQSDFQRAADAQKSALAEQKKAEQADQAVTDAQKKLAEAQAKAQAQHAKAEQAQKDAQQAAQQAQQQGTPSQSEALQHQQTESQTAQQLQQENPQAWSQSQNIQGKVTAATADELTVLSPSQGDMRLKLNDSTAITIDGRQGSADQIQPGSDVRASYRLIDGKPTAMRVQVTKASQ
jgi:colicin import membrane protein